MASNWRQLRRQLATTDIRVAPRPKRRPQEERETWSICRLLATLGRAKRLIFPIKLEHRDRPDFVIRAANDQIGVEICEAISEQYARAADLAAREFPNQFIELGHFRPDAPERSPDDIRALFRQKRLTSAGWSGPQAEQDWAEFMHRTIKAKRAKLRAAAFSRFPNNWLLIYDNLPLPNIDLELAVSILRRRMRNSWRNRTNFDQIIVDCGRTLLLMTKSGYDLLSVNDLWKKRPLRSD